MVELGDCTDPLVGIVRSRFSMTLGGDVDLRTNFAGLFVRGVDLEAVDAYGFTKGFTEAFSF